MDVSIQRFDNNFDQWSTLLALLNAAFAFQTERINPPSSLAKLNAKSLEQKAKKEILFLAWHGEKLIGCIFANPLSNNTLYVGKHAVLPNLQGKGIGHALMHAIESEAKANAVDYLELQVRIELTENIATFKALGYNETKRTSHPGFSTITSITMQKKL